MPLTSLVLRDITTMVQSVTGFGFKTKISTQRNDRLVSMHMCWIVIKLKRVLG
jgi:hypothetical protein